MLCLASPLHISRPTAESTHRQQGASTTAHPSPFLTPHPLPHSIFYRFFSSVDNIWAISQQESWLGFPACPCASCGVLAPPNIWMSNTWRCGPGAMIPTPPTYPKRSLAMAPWGEGHRIPSARSIGELRVGGDGRRGVYKSLLCKQSSPFESFSIPGTL